jgi:predicted transposase YbfD/YdcC
MLPPLFGLKMEVIMARKKRIDKKFLELTKEIDIEKFRDSVKSEFHNITDLRDSKRIKYPAWYVTLVILCGYLAGCNTIEDIADYSSLKGAWFSELTGTTYGGPCYNTIWWFLVRLEPQAFKQLLTNWFQRLPRDLVGQLLVIDGKRLRGVSKDKYITHLVELFAAQDRLVIAQAKVPDKKGEAQALPELLDAVDIKGAIVSFDALYTHIEETQQVRKRGAHFIAGIKGNQPKLHDETMNYFEQAYSVDYEGVDVDRFQSCEKGHGRIEERKICVSKNIDWLPQKEEWELKALIEVRSKRLIKGKSETATRYYGASCEGSAKQFAGWIREHWSIENNLHWVADVVFKEDASLGDTGHSAENMSLIRRLAMNIIQVFDGERGISAARRCATHSPEYLRGLLGKVFC